MTTAIDTNILVALWDTDPQLNSAVQKALDSAQARGARLLSLGPFTQSCWRFPDARKRCSMSFLAQRVFSSSGN